MQQLRCSARGIIDTVVMHRAVQRDHYNVTSRWGGPGDQVPDVGEAVGDVSPGPHVAERLGGVAVAMAVVEPLPRLGRAIEGSVLVTRGGGKAPKGTPEGG